MSAAPLSFWTIKRGRYEPFDVPAESFADGQMTGLRAAGEFMRVMPDLNRVQVHEVLLATVAAANERPTGRAAVGRGGASSAFVWAIVDFLRFAAANCNHGAHIAQLQKDAESCRDFMKAMEAREKAEFVQRMRQARAAKRARAEVAA